MRVWGHTILNLLEAGKDTGWVVAIVLICVSTFVVAWASKAAAALWPVSKLLLN